MKKNNSKANNVLGGAKAETKTTLQKQGTVICVLAAIVALFLIFYFAILPNIQQRTAKVTYTYPGEYYEESSQTLYMITPVNRSAMKKIEVKNEFGTYVLNEKGSGSGKTFVLEDAAETVLDEYSVSGVVVAVGQPITAPADSKTYRASETATADDLKKFGLDEASDPNWFRVTQTDGSSYRIFFGDKLPAGSGCYAYVEGEDRMRTVTNEDGTESKYYIVYVLDSTTYKTLLYGKTGLVNTLVGTYLGSGAYYATKFEVYRYEDGERGPVINITENANPSGSGVDQFALVYPGGYRLNSDVLTQQVLPTLVSFEAEMVMELGDEIYDEEVYSKYGLDLDRDRLAAGTDTNYTKFYIEALDSNSETAEITLYVSKLQLLSDGTSCYYAYVPSQHEIVRLSAETFEWLDWDFGEYVDLRMFFEYIGSLDYFSILSADKTTDARFTLTGNPYNHHVAVTDSTGKTVLVDPETGKEIVFDVEWEPGVVSPTFKGDFENFRALYYVLITRMLDGSEEPRKVADDATPTLNVVVQSIQRDRNSQYYLYDEDGEYLLDENGKSQAVTYEGGFVIVKNLKGKTKDGFELTYKEAYYDEKTGKYFVKAKDSADGNEKPRSYKITDDEIMQPIYLTLTDTTAEYTLVTYEYEFYDLYDEVTGEDGTVSKKLNQTYMLVVPTTTTSVWRIEADGTRTLVSQEVSENDNMGFYIRRASVDKLVSDTGKALAGIEIDEWGVN